MQKAVKKEGSRKASSGNRIPEYYKGLYQVYAGQQTYKFTTEQSELLNIKHSEFRKCC
jgi:hypothetical protein